MVVTERSPERDEANLLQHDVAIGIRQHLLFDPVPSLQLRINQLVGGNPGRDRDVLELAMAFFFGEVACAVGDDQSHVTGASLVHTRVINFVQDAMAGGEPNPAVLIQGRAHATLRARSPARRNPRPTRSVSFVTHCLILESSECMVLETVLTNDSGEGTTSVVRLRDHYQERNLNMMLELG